LTTLRCADCGAVHLVTAAVTACSSCGGLLDLELELPVLRGAGLRHAFAERRDHNPARKAEEAKLDRSGVWRFRELVLPMHGGDVVSYPEGNTPLIDNVAVSDWAGAPRLWLKHEGMNPTGSFKDRGMSVAVTQAKRIRATAVISASTGNTSSSMAAYAAIAGIPAVVLVPAGAVSGAKLAQTIAYGARTLNVRGDFDACLRLAREASTSLGHYLVNSVNPFRLAGQRTIVFELLEQHGWNAPDWIALPAGNLGNASAFGAALRVARDAGLINRMPRLLLVQAAGAAPFARAFERDFAERVRVTPTTIASAIRIGDPASYDRAVRAIRESNGVVTSVTDDEILAAKRAIDRAGIGCEPASAASVAGVRQLVANGMIGGDERVVAVLTGHLLKDVDAGGVNIAERVEIDPTLQDIEQALESTL
jgi:threonine synthase